MSEEKSTESNESAIDSIKESVEDVVEEMQEVVQNTAEAVEETVEAAVPPLMKLKQENPKLFFGGIAGIVVVLGLFFLSGGDSTSKRHAQQVTYTVGQSYTLQAPNALTDTSLKILKVPGQMASFDNPEDVVCNAPVGTQVIARDFQDAFGKKQLFVQVEIQQEVADCRQGVKGWTLKNNLK